MWSSGQVGVVVGFLLGQWVVKWVGVLSRLLASGWSSGLACGGEYLSMLARVAIGYQGECAGRLGGGNLRRGEGYVYEP